MGAGQRRLSTDRRRRRRHGGSGSLCFRQRRQVKRGRRRVTQEPQYRCASQSSDAVDDDDIRKPAFLVIIVGRRGKMQCSGKMRLPAPAVNLRPHQLQPITDRLYQGTFHIGDTRTIIISHQNTSLNNAQQKHSVASSGETIPQLYKLINSYGLNKSRASQRARGYNLQIYTADKAGITSNRVSPSLS